MKKMYCFAKTFVWVCLFFFVGEGNVSSSENHPPGPALQKEPAILANIDYLDNAAVDYPPLVPLSGYTTEKGKALAQRYRAQLIRIIKALRQHYPLSQMEIRAVGFLKSPRCGERDDRYLSVIMEVSEEYESEKTSFKQRAGAVFRKYVDSVATILLKFEDTLADKEVAGVAVCPNWTVKPSKKASPPTEVSEGMFVCINSKLGKKFFQRKISFESLAAQAKVYARQGNTIFDLTDMQINE